MKLVKIFCEVRFEPAFLFDDGRTRNEIHKQLKEDFPVLQMQEDNKVLLFVNPKNTSNCQVYQDRIVIDIDNPSDIGKIKTLSNATMPFIMKKLEVEKSIRVGVRAHYIDENVLTSVDSSKLILDNFFSNGLIDFIGEQIGTEDNEPKVVFRLNVNHEFRMNVNIAYLQKIKSGQINNKMELTVTEFEKVYPLTDLDIYTQVHKEPQQLNGVIGGMCSYLENYCNKIWKRGI